MLGAIFGATALLAIPTPSPSVPNAPSPEQMRASVIGLVFLGLMAGLGVAIGVGLLRRRTWARYVAIVVGFFLATICVLSAVLICLVPVPEPPGVPPNFTTIFRTGIVVFYVLLIILFGGISAFLLRASMREQFSQEHVGSDLTEGVGGRVVEQEPKPLAVLTVAALTLFALLSLPYLLSMSVPILMFGVEIPGPAGKLGLTVWMLLFALVGVGLIRRVRNAFWVSLAFYGMGLLNGILNLRPGVFEHYVRQLPQYGSYQPEFASQMVRAGMFMGVVGGILPIILLLVGRRKYFAWCEQRQLAVAPPQA
jgi:hypothetical protein